MPLIGLGCQHHHQPHHVLRHLLNFIGYHLKVVPHSLQGQAVAASVRFHHAGASSIRSQDHLRFISTKTTSAVPDLPRLSRQHDPCSHSS